MARQVQRHQRLEVDQLNEVHKAEHHGRAFACDTAHEEVNSDCTHETVGQWKVEPIFFRTRHCIRSVSIESISHEGKIVLICNEGLVLEDQLVGEGGVVVHELAGILESDY